MNKSMKKSLAVALGTTFAAAMSASPVVNAEANPFGMQSLESGYVQVAEAEGGEDKMKKEGKCGEGKCGEGKMKKDGEGKMKKEGKCGEGKCGEGKMKKDGEGKCGEGKMKKDGEGKCGGSE